MTERSCKTCIAFRPKPEGTKGDCRMNPPQLYGVVLIVAGKPTMGPGGILQPGPPQQVLQERSGFPEVEGSWECQQWNEKPTPMLVSNMDLAQ